MPVRPETPADHPAIARINIAAFADHPYSRQTEHRIIDALRRHGALTLSFVAEHEGEVVGHIAFSPARIGGIDIAWYTLGPLAVLPNFQGRGIGAQLVRTGLDALHELNARGCLLVGDPAYYQRFGFRQTEQLLMNGVPQEYILCLPIVGDIPTGTAEHHPAFSVSD